MRHQWHRQADALTAGIAVGWSALELAGVVVVVALLVVTVLHDWTGDAVAGAAAAAGIDDEMVSTASKAGTGEP